MNAPFNWPEAAIADLRKFRAEGLSASQIAKRLSAEYRHVISRNSVIGKCMRLGIPGMSKDAVTATVKATHARRAVKPAKTPKERVDADAIRERRAADLLRVAREEEEARKAAVVVPIRPARQHPDEIAVAPCCLEALTFSSCRWPLERTTDKGEVLFCANEKAEGRVYCEGHAKRAFVKTQTPEQKRAAQLERERNRDAARAAGRTNSFFGIGQAKRLA